MRIQNFFLFWIHSLSFLLVQGLQIYPNTPPINSDSILLVWGLLELYLNWFTMAFLSLFLHQHQVCKERNYHFSEILSSLFSLLLFLLSYPFPDDECFLYLLNHLYYDSKHFFLNFNYLKQLPNFVLPHFTQHFPRHRYG